MRLTDGAEIVVRPIEPEDAHEIAVGFGRLGALSRFRLFRRHICRLTSEQLVARAHVGSRGLAA